MGPTQSPPPAPLTPERLAPPRSLSFDKFVGILWDSAWEALVTAFLAWLLGGIALGIVSGLFKEMTPSRPPLVGGSQSPEVEPVAQAAPSHAWDWVGHTIAAHRFASLFGLIFAVTVAGRLVRYLKDPRQRRQPRCAECRTAFPGAGSD